MKKVLYRQGDILLRKVENLPPSATREQGERCILAHGEATGHTHEVLSHGQIFVDVNDQGRRYLQVTTDTSLRHQEHGEIALKGPAVFEIIRQREYRPEGLRNVAD